MKIQSTLNLFCSAAIPTVELNQCLKRLVASKVDEILEKYWGRPRSFIRTLVKEQSKLTKKYKRRSKQFIIFIWKHNLFSKFSLKKRYISHGLRPRVQQNELNKLVSQLVYLLLECIVYKKEYPLIV